MANRSEVGKEIFYNMLPVRRGERIWGAKDFMAIQICFGIAAWFFLVGSLTGLTVKASDAVPIILFGNMFPLFLIACLAIMFSRFGTEQWVASSAIFGHKLKDIWFWIYITSSYGWIAYASFLFGEAAIKFVAFFNGPAILTTEVPGAMIFAYIACVVGAVIAFMGPHVLQWFTRIAAVFLMVVLIGFIVQILNVYGIAHVYAAKPAEPMATLAWSRASAIEWNVGLGFSWAFWYGQWTRLAKSETGAYHGCQWGWGILAATAGIFAAFTALVLGVYDPSEWIIALAMPGIAAVGLVMFAIANIGSVTCLVYPMSITFRSRFPKFPWLGTVALVSLPAFILMNPVVFANYGVYLAYIALLTGTYGGIFIADYFLVNKGTWTWSLRQMYNRTWGYRYWKGFNPAALIATVVAAGFYLWTLDPFFWTSPNGLFPYITAGIPSFIIAFIVYALLMKFWVMKAIPAPQEGITAFGGAK